MKKNFKLLVSFSQKKKEEEILYIIIHSNKINCLNGSIHILFNIYIQLELNRTCERERE